MLSRTHAAFPGSLGRCGQPHLVVLPSTHDPLYTITRRRIRPCAVKGMLVSLYIDLVGCCPLAQSRMSMSAIAPCQTPLPEESVRKAASWRAAAVNCQSPRPSIYAGQSTTLPYYSAASGSGTRTRVCCRPLEIAPRLYHEATYRHDSSRRSDTSPGRR